MAIAAVRLLTAALAHATYGVNAQLLAMPYEAGDTAPTPLALIVDETTADQVAEMRLATALPSLSLNQGPTEAWDGEVGTTIREGVVSVVVRYATEAPKRADGVGSMALGLVHADQVQRALRLTLRQWLLNANSADRFRNGLWVKDCQKIEHYAIAASPNDDLIVSDTVCTFNVRETQP